MTAPGLSVVLVPLGGARAVREAAAAIAAACDGVTWELIVPVPPRLRPELTDTANLPPGTSFLPADDDNPWVLRALGVRAARAPVVVTFEDHARPVTGYGARVLAAHQQPHAAIGGVVAKAGHDTATGWAMYFLDYGRYIPPQHAGPREYLTACNVSYKAASLAAVRGAWSHDMHETTVHMALRARGETLWLDPALVVMQQRDQSFGEAVAEVRRHGEAFGRDLADHLPASRRSVRVLASPLVPVLQLLRAASHLRRAPHLLPRFVLAFPALFALAVSWGRGEAAGLWSGRR